MRRSCGLVFSAIRSTLTFNAVQGHFQACERAATVHVPSSVLGWGRLTDPTDDTQGLRGDRLQEWSEDRRQARYHSTAARR